SLGASLGHVSMGMSVSWANALIGDLRTDNTTLLNAHISLDDWERNMMNNMVFAGSVPGFLVAGWLVAVLGRKGSMVAGATPGMLGWCIVAMATNTKMLIAARCLLGLTNGLLSVAANTYVVEIPETAIRG
ncbi:unnamed protein product, partial [Meganyctiphanes norvegica]